MGDAKGQVQGLLADARTHPGPSKAWAEDGRASAGQPAEQQQGATCGHSCLCVLKHALHCNLTIVHHQLEAGYSAQNHNRLVVGL